MADPFSIGAGVVGVVALAIQIVQIVTQLGLDWKDAPTEVKAFGEELRVLAQTLSVTQTNILQNPDFAAAFDNRPSLLLSQLGANAPNDTDAKVMIQSCERHLRDLLRDLEKRARGHRVGWERLKGAFLVKHTRELIENLHRQCQTLNNMVVIDTVALSAKTHTEVKVIQEEQRDARQEQHDAIVASQRWLQEERAQAILQWLSAAEYRTQQSDFFHRRQDGTGQWLLDSIEFRHWRSNNATTLYCHGMPGAGKTIMTSIIINKLCTEVENDPSTGIAYIYCNFRQKDEQKPANLLASLLKQLILNRPKMPTGVERLYEHHQAKQTRPLLGEILTELHFVVSAYSKSFIVVDALDECSISEGGRHEFISELLSLQVRAGCNIFVTSRINPQIARELGTGYTRLEVRASDADVRRYLESQVHRLPAFVQRSTDVQKEINSGITNTVKGMFLLARLHLESLTAVRSVKVLRTRLATLPAGSNAYNRAYTEAMERIKAQRSDAQDLAFQTLSWISCAKRALTVQEIRHALAVEQNTQALDKDNFSEVDDIVSVCAGLVVVDEDSQIIRLVHYTTQEFFEREWAAWFPHAQVNITMTCATYLLFDIFESGFCCSDDTFKERLRLNALYDYAARYWGYHAQVVSAEVILLLLRLLSSENKVSACSQALMVPEYRYKGYSQSMASDWTGLHIAAYFGLRTLMESLLGEGFSPDRRDSKGESPLSIGAQGGHEGVVKLLLELDDVEADSKDKYGQTPLSWAAEWGHEAVVKLMVERDDVEADSKDKDGHTPLSWAASGGHEAVVKLLVERDDVEADSKDEEGQTPLSRAAMKGHEAVVELLVERDDVEADSKDEGGYTILSQAAEEGHEAVVKLLVERDDVDVDSKDEGGHTPLSRAAMRGHEAVVKLLVERDDVETDSKDKYGHTPLSWAAIGGHEAVVKLLVERDDVEADSKDEFGQTPLSWAASGGHEAVVKLLVERDDVEVDSKDKYDQTPLSQAAMRGHEAVVKLLVERDNVDADSKDGHGQTPLSRAAMRGHEAVVKLLVERDDVETDSKDKDGHTPLSWAASEGHEAVVKLLVERDDVDADSKDEFGRTPLLQAAENGHGAVAGVLLDTGKVNCQTEDLRGLTAFQLAAFNGNDEVESLLAAWGAPVRCKGRGGRL